MKTIITTINWLLKPKKHFNWINSQQISRKIAFFFIFMSSISFAQVPTVAIEGINGTDYVSLKNTENRIFYLNLPYENGEELFVEYIMPSHLPRSPISIEWLPDLMGILTGADGLDLYKGVDRVKLYEEILQDLFFQSSLSKAGIVKFQNNLNAFNSKIQSLTKVLDPMSGTEFMTNVLDGMPPNSRITKGAKIIKSKNVFKNLDTFTKVSSEAMEYYVGAVLSNYEANERMKVFERHLTHAYNEGIFYDPAIVDAYSNVKLRLEAFNSALNGEVANVINNTGTAQLTRDILQSVMESAITNAIGGASIFEAITCNMAKVVDKSGSGALESTCNFAFDVARNKYALAANNGKLILMANIDYYLFYLTHPDRLEHEGYNELTNRIIDNGVVYDTEDYYLSELRIYFNYTYSKLKAYTLQSKTGDLDENFQVQLNKFLVKIGNFNERNIWVNELVYQSRIAQTYYERLHKEPRFSTPTFPDIQGHWVVDYIDLLISRNIINGNPDGNFYPNIPLTRGELAKVVVNAAKIPINETGTPFDDVPPSNVFFKYVQTLKNIGYVNGLPGSNNYGLNLYVTRAEAAKIIANGFGFIQYPIPSEDYDNNFTDVAPNSPFNIYINALKKRRIISGYVDQNGSLTGNFGPSNNITRAEMVKIIEKAIKIKESF